MKREPKIEMTSRPIHVLLVDDDEDDYVLFRDMLADISNATYRLEWAPDEKAAMEKIEDHSYDICLMDFRLGERNGIEVFHELKRRRVQTPIIILTAYGAYDLDVQAMLEGAADYLEKRAINAVLLERSIRYAVNRTKTLVALKASEEKLRALSIKIIEAQENERRRIAGELHDSLGADLTAIKFALEHHMNRMVSEPVDSQRISLKRIIDLVQKTTEEARRISTDLRPSVLDDLGILAAARSMLRQFQTVHPKIRIESRLDIREADVPDSLKIVIYRLFQEALNNAFKHSGANAVWARLTKSDERLEWMVRDNGTGFDVEEHISDSGETGSLGLSGMRERIELSNGIFNLESEPGVGTTLRAVWSVNQGV
jgi:signal transduction histidine kinase